jgi:hypothetical protein
MNNHPLLHRGKIFKNLLTSNRKNAVAFLAGREPSVRAEKYIITPTAHFVNRKIA